MFLVKQKNKYLNIYRNKWVDDMKSATLFKSYRNAKDFDMWHLDSEIVEVIDNGYYFKSIKEFINEPKSKESFEKARKMCYDLYLDKEVQEWKLR